jgi:hypothetical protein
MMELSSHCPERSVRMLTLKTGGSRFGQAGVGKEKISMVKDTYYFASPEKNPTRFIESFETFYGPTMNAVAAA